MWTYQFLCVCSALIAGVTIVHCTSQDGASQAAKDAILPHVVIIGAGIGGSTCAYYLRKEVPGVNVTVIEARDRIGGRIKDIEYHGLSVNVGAGVFSKYQRVIAGLAQELNLTVDRLPASGDCPKTFVWDGQNIVQTDKLVKREPDALLKMKQSLNAFVKATEVNYQTFDKETFKSVPEYLKAGGLDIFTRQSTDDFFRGTAVSDTVKKYAIETVIREFYGQDSTGSALLGVSCLAGIYEDSFKTRGGMNEIVKALISASGCNLHLNSRVTRVTRAEGDKFVVTYRYGKKDVTVNADVVVIAAPLEYTGIKFEGFKSDPSTQPARHWQHLYNYVNWVTAKSINPRYFRRDPTSWPKRPTPLYTTSNTTLPWVVIRQLDWNQDYSMFHITAPANITQGDLMHDLFEGVLDYRVQQWDYVFPMNPPIREDSTYQGIVLDDRLYSVNALESIASHMETSAVSGRNIAKLIAKLGIMFDGFKRDLSTQPVRQWQPLYGYMTWVTAKSIRPEYFGKDPSSWTRLATPLFTTSNTTQPWITIRQSDWNQDYSLYKVSSPINITQDDLVHDLFEDVLDYRIHQWEYVYPLNPPIREDGDYQSIVLDNGLYNLNSLESMCTKMEASVVSARNVARLIASLVNQAQNPTPPELHSYTVYFMLFLSFLLAGFMYMKN